LHACGLSGFSSAAVTEGLLRRGSMAARLPTPPCLTSAEVIEALAGHGFACNGATAQAPP